MTARHGDLSVEASAFLSLGVMLLLHGFYTALYALCMRVLICLQRQRNWILIAALSALFLSTTIHIVLSFVFTFDAFVQAPKAAGTFSYLAHYHRPINGADYTLWWISCTISESLILWRVYIIWQATSRWNMVIPVFLYICTLGSTGFSTVIHVRQSILRIERTDQRNYWILVIFLGIMLVQNLWTTCMIGGRLWYMGRRVGSKMRTSPYQRLILAVIESATIWSLTIMVIMLLSALELNQMSNVAQRAGTIIMGIAPTLVVLTTNFKMDPSRAPSPAMGENTSITEVGWSGWEFKHDQPETSGKTITMHDEEAGSSALAQQA